ncbi:GntR family transcriptional regulator [Nocardia mangyaensis]|uniref:GntR family transcriptional regulator n=1 Tax=Nocardia mangyaensis TaxID=2213200 RepID=UPI00267666C0|nr:GntR family transcriptional regulator [Nocardia mangyaensis]MDO3651175.1 GntR family transcriptional regulator [Nocardia mangyaensis]
MNTDGDARHRQIARELRNEIEAGRLRPGQKLPSTRALAEQFGVSVAPINDAMAVLESEGLVVSKPRSGRAVSDTATPGAPRRRVGRPQVIYVGGYAGSGKTEFGRTLARESGWAMLDKDTITRSVVDAALVQLGSSPADRESDLYMNVVRPAEYECLAATVTENVSCGVSVIATAPFIKEFSSEAWFRRTAVDLDTLGADMTVVWIRADADSMHSYITRRGAARDSYKLANWAQYTDAINLTFAPAWDYTLITNNADSAPLRDQAQDLLAKIAN